MKPTYGSLFAGVGGFDIGLDAAGWQCGFQVEIDKHCQQVLNRHWPSVPKWGDITTVNGNELPPVDLLTFGSPCQDLSVAGKRAGLEGARSGLFHHAIRIAREMRNATNNQFPRVIVWENVAGALSSNSGRDFGTAINEMAEIGSLVIEWAVLDAQHFGIPQRRRRVFVVAILDPATAGNCPDPLLPVSEGVRRNSATRNQQGQESAGPIAACIGNSSYGGWKFTDQAVTLSARDYKQGTTMAVYGITGHAIGRSDIAGPNDPSHTAEDGPMFTLTSTDRHAVVMAFDTQFGSNANVFMDQAPPLKSTQAPPSVMASAVRRLTPMECERLMGWPDDHTRWRADGKEQTDAQRYRQIGNGIASPVAQWLGGHIRNALGGTKR